MAKTGSVEAPAAKGSGRDVKCLQVVTSSVRRVHWVDNAMLLACKAGWMGRDGWMEN